MIDSFDDFHAHAAVVIRAFPESGLVVIAVDGPVFAKAPEPFAVFPVDQIGLYEIPACQGIFQAFLGAEMIPEVEVADHGLGLYPPMTVPVGFLGVLLVDHAPFWRKSLAGSCRYGRNKLLDTPDDRLVTKNQCGFMDEP